MNLTNETLTTQQQKYTAFWHTPKDPRRDMTKDVEASLNNNEKKKFIKSKYIPDALFLVDYLFDSAYNIRFAY